MNLILEELRRRGYAARMVPLSHLAELRRRIETQRRDGLLDETFFRERLGGFRFEAPADLPDAVSVIVLAVRQPQKRVTFNPRGRRLPVTVPPTYLHFDDIGRELLNEISQILRPLGFHAAAASLPEKLLAACAGLARYGRNNIAYVQGMGSFQRLAAFFCDVPCDDGAWEEPAMLERCHRCRSCVTACPSGAIDRDRFLLRAERCIVFHNERDGATPFPSWVQPEWHECLVGCMHCQKACPENGSFLGWIEDEAEFSQEETGLLLSGAPREQLPASTAKKLQDADLMGMLGWIPRNLGALLRRLEIP
ncbi:MAG TPA: 4Fe-4S double cluster binding domain-containing protein [Spirochaetia bacterium]|nr:4Fe-4S double cluster binding domain-containing protein [Spirochaetia bacterium]